MQKLQTDLRAIGPEAKLSWELKEKYPFDFGPTLVNCEAEPISRCKPRIWRDAIISEGCSPSPFYATLSIFKFLTTETRII